MVAQRDAKDNLILAWSFELARGQEIMIDDDHHHTGGVIYLRVTGVLLSFIYGRDGR
jgi:hypothetical protein